MPRHSGSRACPSTPARPASLYPLGFPSCWLRFDRYCLFRAVVGTHAGLRLERGRHLLFEHDAVPELVGREYVGPEDVTTTVTDAEVGIDAHSHHEAERIRGSFTGRTRYAPRGARIAVEGLRTGCIRRGRRDRRVRMLGWGRPGASRTDA